jgi:hypothetical protein
MRRIGSYLVGIVMAGAAVSVIASGSARVTADTPSIWPALRCR